MSSQLRNQNLAQPLGHALKFIMLCGVIISNSLGCDENEMSTRREGFKDGGQAQTGQDLIDMGGLATPAEVAGSSSIMTAGEIAGETWITDSQSEEITEETDEREAGSLNDPFPAEMMHSFAPAPEGYPSFSFPINEEDRALIKADPVFGFDHDPRDGHRIRCTDYAGRGFPHCYDGHEGSDFMLEGGFDTMDAGSARVVAALAGEVISIEDGNYDRCHADLFSADISCDGNPMRANFVRIRHDNDWVSLYYHLKNGSVRVQPGQFVECGDVLGLVGSSGYSSSPHLHFEVIDGASNRWDPFAGTESQSFSLWTYQPEQSSEGTGARSSESLPSNSCSSPSR